MHHCSNLPDSEKTEQRALRPAPLGIRQSIKRLITTGACRPSPKQEKEETKMLSKTLITVSILPFIWATSASSLAEEPIIDGKFRVQQYEIPDTSTEGFPGEGFRHMTATINEASEELIVFGGLGNSPNSGPYNDRVYTLDLTEKSSRQEWVLGNNEGIGISNFPWFTSTRGFVDIDDDRYLACTDDNTNSVFFFDPTTYTFSPLSTSDLGSTVDAGDCCAVGVTTNGEERVYLLGGRRPPSPQFALRNVRYYSVTHGTWHQVADMNVGRSHLGCISVESQGAPLIYAIGGGNSPAGEVFRSIEVYDVSTDTWTLYDDYFPEGRQRLGTANIDNKFIALIGGDATCAGGGGANCLPDQPLKRVDLIDIENDNRFISSEDYSIPQLKIPRQTPATSLRKQDDEYSLYAIGGRSRFCKGVQTSNGLCELITTEVLSFEGIEIEVDDDDSDD